MTVPEYWVFKAKNPFLGTNIIFANIFNAESDEYYLLSLFDPEFDAVKGVCGKFGLREVLNCLLFALWLIIQRKSGMLNMILLKLFYSKYFT